MQPFLLELHRERPEMFPVESLNASMVLAAIHARLGERLQTDAILHEALKYYRTVSEDFEVKVNFRLRPWLEQALDFTERGMLEQVRPYPFPYGSYEEL